MDLLEQARRVIGIEREGLVRMADWLDGAFVRAVEVLREIMRSGDRLATVWRRVRV